MNKTHKTGWISVVGNPNVGKSTLVNALVGEKLSIVTHKPQTTRHRITAIANDTDYQMVFSDTPGVIKPHYKMQEAMMKRVGEAMEDADIIMAVTDVEENGFSPDVILKLQNAKVPVIAILNKVDLKKQEDAMQKLELIKTQLKPKELLAVSALHGFHVPELKNMLIGYLPEGEPFFPKEQMSDLPEKFFAAEILREKILLYYQKEIPYSVEVIIEEFRETEKITFIRAVIYVNRHTQKGIIIGHKGAALKKTATAARKDMEKWLNAKVFLEVQVKVKKDWRDSENQLKNFGYL
ncbi:MAG: GTPase Era [Bacteroidia bacterium]